MKRVLLLCCALFVLAQERFLLPEEIAWIKAHPQAIVGITQIPNQVLETDKGFEGFSIDLFKLLSQKSGLEFDYRYFHCWSEVIEAAKSGEIDIIFLAQKTPERLSYLDFTDTILVQENFLICNFNRPYRSLNELKNKRLALSEKSALEEFVRYYYPTITIIPTKSEKEALMMVANNKADATIAEPVRSSYYIRQLGLDTLVPTSPIEYKYYLALATTKRHPTLNIILSKSLQHIPPHKLDALKLKWGYIKAEILDKNTLLFLSVLLIVSSTILGYFLIINHRLKEEIKAKEQALQRVERLKDSKLSELSQMVRTIAHQWRQPLNTLSATIQIIEFRIIQNKLDPKSLQELLQKLKKQVFALSQIIDKFQETFRPTSKQVRFDLISHIKTLIHILKPTFQEQDIKLILISAKESIPLMGYPESLSKVLFNILTNAKEALEKSDQKNKQVLIKIKQTQKELHILIEDNGGGIPKEFIDHIFEPYFSTKEEKNNRGLGLYTAKTVVEEKLGGKLLAYNNKEGATFEIVLPMI